MARSFVLRVTLRAVVIWACCQALPAVIAAVPVSVTLQEAVESGQRLERDRNWRDAVEHYEQSLEQWPDDEHLSYGLRRARFQFSIERRYTDASFRRELLPLSQAESLDVLDHVLNRIQFNFVESISTQSIIAHGTESLWLALSNQRYLDENASGADAEQVREFRRILRNDYWNKPIPGRDSVRGVIAEVCDHGRRLLGLEPGAIVMEYVFGACNCLDEYSNVLTPTRYSDLFDNIDGQFVGIGIVIEGRAGKGMWLIDVLPDSPAEEAGLTPGDWIVGIDGVDCRNLSTEEAAGYLSGAPGTPVTLEVGRNENYRKVTCRRREVKVKSIPVAKMIDSSRGVAYIRLTGFQKNSTTELDAALKDLQAQGMRSLIWDLRGNPGGLLREAVSLADRFIGDGVIVSTKGRTPDQNETFRAFGPGTWTMPLVLLIDENSASASEIIAGAIRDHHRGTLVGRTSFGKWSVQSIYATSNGMGLRLTTAKFYSPGGHTFSKIGVAPDVAVAGPEDGARQLSRTPNLQDDPDLRAALEVLQNPTFTRR